MTEPRDILSHLQGLFEAFEWVNGKDNNGFSFNLTLLPKLGTLIETLERHFRSDAISVEVELLTDAERELRRSISRWLFRHLDDFGYQLSDPRKSFALSFDDNRGELVDLIVSRLTKVLSSSVIYRVTITPDGFYECDWDDFAFESETELLLLHLGVAD